MVEQILQENVYWVKTRKLFKKRRINKTDFIVLNDMQKCLNILIISERFLRLNFLNLNFNDETFKCT